MAIQDGLAISSGPNRGEAAFLGESSFDPVEYSYQWAQRKRQEKAQDIASQTEGAALLNDKIKTQWDSDSFNYFNPKAQALRSTIMDAMRETKGRLSPIQKMEFKGAWDELKGEADVNNELWKSYQNQVKNLEADPQGEKWDRDVSIKKLQMFRDPYAVPELKADIEKNYGGNINAWRTANYANFGLQPSYSFEKHIGDITKDEKVQDYTVKDPKTGKPVEGKYSTGEKYITVGQKYSPEQVSSITNRVWNESNYKSDKAKERAFSFVNDTFSLGDGGIVTFPSDMPAEEKRVAQKAIEYAGDMRGLKKDEIEKKLAKGYLSAVIDIRGDQGTKPHDLGFAPKADKGAGSGKGFNDVYAVASTPYTTGGGIKEFNQKYHTDLPESMQRLATHKDARVVSIEPKDKGTDKESFQLVINGKTVRPINYIVEPNGKIYGTFAVPVKIGEKADGTAILEDQAKEYELNDKLLANVVTQYGFSGNTAVQDFKRDALGIEQRANDPLGLF